MSRLNSSSPSLFLISVRLVSSSTTSPESGILSVDVTLTLFTPPLASAFTFTVSSFSFAATAFVLDSSMPPSFSSSSDDVRVSLVSSALSSVLVTGSDVSEAVSSPHAANAAAVRVRANITAVCFFVIAKVLFLFHILKRLVHGNLSYLSVFQNRYDKVADKSHKESLYKDLI